jgi:hypothetical protein
MKTTTLLTTSIWFAAAFCSAQSFTIRYYDYAGLTVEQTASLQDAAGRLLARSGAPVEWVACRGVAACEKELEPNEIVLSLKAALPSTVASKAGTLAYSIVTAKGGQYATLFLDAIREHARLLEVPEMTLLAYAAAHEIGHCLAGPGHSRAGVMKAAWARSDSDDIRQQRLSFGSYALARR